MDLVYSGELLLNLQELFSDQPSLLCQKKLILGGMIKIMAGSSYATASRRKILEYLKNSNDHTVTAADVDEYLKKHDSEVNITTIYR